MRKRISKTAPKSPARAPTPVPPAAPPAPVRRRRADGKKSHEEILRAAASLASVEGLEGLSLAGLASHVGLSKSGLFSHFRSKEELQLETIDMAGTIFKQEVVAPAMAQLEGLPRLRALVDGFLHHVGRRTFPGGCFFASVAAEMDGRPGKIRDVIASFHRDWTSLFRACVAEAQDKGQLDRAADTAQVSFEVLSMLAGAHGVFLLQGDESVLDRARRGVEAVLASHPGRKAHGR